MKITKKDHGMKLEIKRINDILFWVNEDEIRFSRVTQEDLLLLILKELKKK